MRNEMISAITTPDAPGAVAAYSQGVLIQRGDYREVVTSGQIALHPETKKLVEGGIVPQTERVLENVGAILDAGGAKPGDVYKTDVVVTNPADFGPFNGVYQGWDWIKEAETLPTRFTSVGGLLIPGSVVEVRASAVYLAPSATIIDLKNGK
jgi:2-iminobutanoate/2-iminopropanoate deaminase